MRGIFVAPNLPAVLATRLWAVGFWRYVRMNALSLLRLTRQKISHQHDSFAENSRKPPFSLGLQSFLELLLHKIGIPRVSQRVNEADALSQQQLDKTVIHGMHAVLSADLN